MSISFLNLLILGVIPMIIMVPLQIFLSLREAKWPGFIIPAMCLIGAVLGILFTFLYLINPKEILISIIVTIVILIPFAINTGIYFICRYYKKRKQPNLSKEVDKMMAKDLD